ncbi:MAG: formate/nitrite transporter family protein [Anaerolineae bacterium]|nr:formate/nitrite transporter family protein [Anaerolineae bacterium]
MAPSCPHFGGILVWANGSRPGWPPGQSKCGASSTLPRQNILYTKGYLSEKGFGSGCLGGRRPWGSTLKERDGRSTLTKHQRGATALDTQQHQPPHAGQKNLIDDLDNHGSSEEADETTAAIDRSQSGAPAGGRAVRDLFSTDEIFQRIVAAADEEFSRSPRILFFSGLAAGLSIGLSFMSRAALTAAIPPEGAAVIGNLLYPIGFIFIVMGHYQLFTENTLTPVTLVLTRLASLPALLTIWGLVLSANLLGATLVALVLATTGVLDPEAQAVGTEIGLHALELNWMDLFVKGIFAGWLVAGMVWIIHAVRDSITRFLSVFLIMYLIPTVGLYHCIVGACEGMYLVFSGEAALWEVFSTFFVPVLLGNTVGGVLLVAFLNYGQTHAPRFPGRQQPEKDLRLNWRDWAFRYHTGGIWSGDERQQ